MLVGGAVDALDAAAGGRGGSAEAPLKYEDGHLSQPPSIVTAPAAP